jgi:hypothetical protein
MIKIIFFIIYYLKKINIYIYFFQISSLTIKLFIKLFRKLVDKQNADCDDDDDDDGDSGDVCSDLLLLKSS